MIPALRSEKRRQPNAGDRPAAAVSHRGQRNSSSCARTVLSSPDVAPDRRHSVRATALHRRGLPPLHQPGGQPGGGDAGRARLRMSGLPSRLDDTPARQDLTDYVAFRRSSHVPPQPTHRQPTTRVRPWIVVSFLSARLPQSGHLSATLRSVLFFGIRTRRGGGHRSADKEQLQANHWRAAPVGGRFATWRRTGESLAHEEVCRSHRRHRLVALSCRRHAEPARGGGVAAAGGAMGSPRAPCAGGADNAEKTCR